MTFSLRNGYEPKPVLQFESMDERLQNGLWNVISRYLDLLRSQADTYERAKYIVQKVWDGHFGESLDDVGNPARGESLIRDKFYNLQWNKVYDFVEFTVAIKSIQRDLTRSFNAVLEREHSAYRVTGEGLVMPITDSTQLEAINAATKETSALAPVHDHLTKAQQLFSIREKPDHYGPSIGEAISAVETLAKMMVGHVGQPNSLAAALDLFPQAGIKLPSQLLDSWRDTWRYASDRKTVRHGKPDDATGTNVSQAEALYMLVKCSGFVSYLLHLASEAKLTL